MPAYLKEDVLQKLTKLYGVDLKCLLAECAYEPGVILEGEAQQGTMPVFNLANLAVKPGYGRRLQESRQNAKLTRRELTAALGWAPKTVAQINGYESERGIPRQGTLIRIAVLLGVPAAWLITGERLTPMTPTPAMRALAVRLNKGLSRQDVATAAFPGEEGGYKKAMHLETKGCMAAQDLVKVAHALDVPVGWLNPQYAQKGAPQDFGDTALPSTVQKLIDDVRRLGASGLLDNGMAAALRKAMFSGQLSPRKAA